ncbi:uncharacterized protein K460DRAFT_120453 [Cucurbitaria berberidis CBS 394.84]|uniref:Uncharacterized protein n=1 Tax=Cucurbitaria berberidis CBS 394.84 TaxID=1168544 RepID=A0A9P4GI91_9PLEO|nr:uncharacterized protein K460DRAFT_120453 [Cucurbitaria berberidis CBS 394.84]KAF1846137.1 hypothetical protein K460DRAFT_120453 [Cucurbitaria berberidis CBS 394.84]
MALQRSFLVHGRLRRKESGVDRRGPSAITMFRLLQLRLPIWFLQVSGTVLAIPIPSTYIYKSCVMPRSRHTEFHRIPFHSRWRALSPYCPTFTAASQHRRR